MTDKSIDRIIAVMKAAPGGDPLQPMPRPGSEVSIGFDEVKAECSKIKMCK